MLTPADARDVELLVHIEEELEAAAVDAAEEAAGSVRRSAKSLDCQSRELEVDTLAHFGHYQPGDPAITDFAQKE